MRRTTMMMTSSAMALSLALSACGGSDEEPTSPSSESASESTPESTSETPSESPSESEAAQAGGSDYCQQLESANKQFTALATGDLAEFDAAIATLRELGDSAPQDISGAWDEVLAPLDQLETALQKAGLTFDDLEGLSRGEIPPGVDPQSLQQLATEVQGLSSADAAQAQTEISEQASSECGITLGQ